MVADTRTDIPVHRCGVRRAPHVVRSEEHTSELQSRLHLVCRLLLEKKNECPEVFAPGPLADLRAAHYATSTASAVVVGPFPYHVGTDALTPLGSAPPRGSSEHRLVL